MISTNPAFSISEIDPESPPYPTVRCNPIVAGFWQYRAQLSTLLVPITARDSFCIRKLSSFVHFDEAINASASGPCSFKISLNLFSITSSASSQLTSRNPSPSLSSGCASLSSELICPHANFPLIQVETPFAGPCSGSIFKMCLSLVQTSNVHPTAQYVHTVFVRFTRALRISDSTSDSARIGPYPIGGSIPFTTSIMSSSTLSGVFVRYPA